MLLKLQNVDDQGVAFRDDTVWANALAKISYTVLCPLNYHFSQKQIFAKNVSYSL